MPQRDVDVDHRQPRVAPHVSSGDSDRRPQFPAGQNQLRLSSLLNSAPHLLRCPAIQPRVWPMPVEPDPQPLVAAPTRRFPPPGPGSAAGVPPHLHSPSPSTRVPVVYPSPAGSLTRRAPRPPPPPPYPSATISDHPWPPHPRPDPIPQARELFSTIFTPAAQDRPPARVWGWGEVSDDPPRTRIAKAASDTATQPS